VRVAKRVAHIAVELRQENQNAFYVHRRNIFQSLFRTSRTNGGGDMNPAILLNPSDEVTGC